jgi:hypothetical protein
MLYKASLERVEAVDRAQASDSLHLASVCLDSQNQAGIDSAAVQEDGTTPAVAFFTSVFDFREPHIPQSPEQGHIGGELGPNLLAVNLELNG